MAKNYEKYADILDVSKREKNLANRPKGVWSAAGGLLGAVAGGLLGIAGGPAGIAAGVGAGGALGAGAGALGDMATEQFNRDKEAKLAEQREQLAAMLQSEAEEEQLRKQAILSLARKYQNFL
jgi:phage tail tape-measure protein